MAGAQAQERAEGAVKQPEKVAMKDVAAGTATEMQTLIGPEDGAPHFAMRRFVMEPGGGIPEHTNTVEHEQYVLRGHANIGIGEESYEVHAGDVVFIPEGAPHWYRNIGEESFEFLCIVPNKEDTITLLGKASC